MAVRRQHLLNQGASTGALETAIAESGMSPASAAAAVRFGDAEMGDSASAAALERLNLAVVELKALTIKPLLQRAVAALGAEDHKTATDLALEALRHDERSGMAWYLLAIAREKAADFKSAISAYESALALTPNQAAIANDLGRLAYRLGLKDVAAQLFQHYRAANPDCAQGANNLACALRDLNKYGEAIDVIRPAILAHPQSAALWNTLGTIVGEQGDMSQALIFFDEALRFEPDFAKARYNRANTRADIGDIDGALADCEAAMVGAQPPGDLMMMRMAHSTMLLSAGRVSEGWDEYESRLDENFSDVVHFLIDRPRWTPQSDLAGKSLLVVGEQGLGDEVLFANLLPDVIEALGPDGKLSLALEPRLLSLFQRSFPKAQIGAHATYSVDGHKVRGMPFVTDPTTQDLWTPMASLLRRFRRTAEAFPDRERFLIPDAERVEHWRRTLAELPGLKVGVLWKSLKLSGSRLRYFSPFEHWRPVLSTPGVSFINLQYGDCDADLAEARDAMGLSIWRPPGIDLKNDLDDVAALGCALDLTIGPANATTNLAAACGGPVWLISTISCWPRVGTMRYPWYPRMRVFMPDEVGVWGPMMESVARELAARVSAGT